MDGPVCFIANGKEVKKYFTLHKIVEKYGLPERSSVYMNDSDYMEYEALTKVVAVLALGIRKITMSL